MISYIINVAPFAQRDSRDHLEMPPNKKRRSTNQDGRRNLNIDRHRSSSTDRESDGVRGLGILVGLVGGHIFWWG